MNLNWLTVHPDIVRPLDGVEDLLRSLDDLLALCLVRHITNVAITGAKALDCGVELVHAVFHIADRDVPGRRDGRMPVGNTGRHFPKAERVLSKIEECSKKIAMSSLSSYRFHEHDELPSTYIDGDKLK